jgi:hypothetical protein
VPVPNDPALRRGRLFWQWVVVDPNGAFLGLACASDGLETLIGNQ